MILLLAHFSTYCITYADRLYLHLVAAETALCKLLGVYVGTT